MKIDHYTRMTEWFQAVDELYGENPMLEMTRMEVGVIMVTVANARVAVWDSGIAEGSVVDIDGVPSHALGYKLRGWDD